MISIIMPIFNRDYVIEETLHSILNQSYYNWECIIVDDGSSDKTFEILKNWNLKDSRFLVFERPKDIPKGPSGCRNYGISKSKGDFIQFFDSDDIMHPEHLKKKIDVIGDSDFSICKLLEFSGNFSRKLYDIKDETDLIVTENLFLNFVKGDFPIFMVAPLWKRKVIAPYLPLREDLHILEDHELYARVLYDTKKYAVVNEYLIYYRVGHHSSTGNFYSNIDTGLRSFFKAKETVLRLTQDREVKVAILKMTLGFFRQALAERNFNAANRCLCFTEKHNLWRFRKFDLFRIKLAYRLFKIVKRGDTKFKFLFKI